MATRKAAAAAPDVNADRGEHELLLGGVTYRLRPSFTAIGAIERKTGIKLLPLARMGNTGDISLADLAIISVELIRAGAEPDDMLTANVGAEAIGQMIYEQGVADVTLAIFRCLLDAATGGRTASGEAKAATA
uniref:GTA-gp10 family protein n=1 Tax=uncultured Sphingomonas sp. TaxID=158754 RepID=UPI0035CC477F